MLDIQLGRRNLSPIQRIAIAEKYRSIYERQAKENMSSGGKAYSPKEGLKNSANLPKENKIDVRAKLATTAGVSTDTYSKGAKILNSDKAGERNASLFDSVSRANEIAVSIKRDRCEC